MTASHFTPRLALPYPDESDPADVPLDIQNLAVKLDGIVARAPGAALSAAPVLDVGVLGQVRAGRQLAAADFTALGLSAPRGLWNLSDLTDASGNGRALSNKGAVPFGTGINGLASTAAVFAGSTGQALYIADTGAADPFRIVAGSVGCWFRTAKRGVYQNQVSKWRTAAVPNQASYAINITSGNTASFVASTDGTATIAVVGVADVADERWHFVVGTYDGSVLRLYVDGYQDGSPMAMLAGALFSCPGPLNIGATEGDGTTAAGNTPAYGRVDEAFVSADVLSLDQVRALYCAKLAHGFAVAPTRAYVNVRRQRRGSAFVVGDFPTQPLRLHNFTAGSLSDQGSNNVTLVNNNGVRSAPGADGTVDGAFSFLQSFNTSLSSTDAGLPAGTAARSYGAWYKTGYVGPAVGVFDWGTTTSADARLGCSIGPAGTLTCHSGADAIQGPFLSDGQWHLIVVTEDNAAGDGLKRKLYVDGALVGSSTVLNPITLAGANRFRLGANQDGTANWTGQLDGVFVCDYILTQAQISGLYAKGAQALGPSPKNAGDHVEYMDATNVYAVFDTIDTQHQIDLAVTA